MVLGIEGSKVLGSRFWVLGCEVQGSKVPGSGFRVQGSGFKVQRFRVQRFIKKASILQP
jgi:hypothetical protein